MPNITSIPAPRVPFVDARTGLISREWYRFILNLFTLTGSGTSDISVTDLAIAPNPVDPFTIVGSAVEQSQLASIAAQYSQFLDIVGVAPVAQVQMPLFEDLTPRIETQSFPDDLSPVAIPYVAPTAAENATVLAATITAATSKTTPVDADELPLVDSAASNVLKKLTWANLKATLATWLQSSLISVAVLTVKSGKTGTAGRIEIARSSDGLAVGTDTMNGNTREIDNAAGDIVIFRGSVERIRATSTGATVAGTITTTGGATFHTTNTALTDGAAAAAGTLLNAPAAGNPTKWIGINDNGTTRYIPAW